MAFIYPLIIAFLIVLVSELGDKTQLLVLSFSTQLKSSTILLGVAFGAFFSHGIAILFGSFLGSINNSNFHLVLQIITYISFIFFGFLGLCSKKETERNRFDSYFLKYKFGYILMIATAIAVGELGDKTFLASIGLGIEYSHYKFFLIIGAVLGMLVSDYIAIFLGKFLSNKFSKKAISIISSILFFIFGILGLLSL